MWWAAHKRLHIRGYMEETTYETTRTTWWATRTWWEQVVFSLSGSNITQQRSNGERVYCRSDGHDFGECIADFRGMQISIKLSSAWYTSLVWDIMKTLQFPCVPRVPKLTVDCYFLRCWYQWPIAPASRMNPVNISSTLRLIYVALRELSLWKSRVISIFLATLFSTGGLNRNILKTNIPVHDVPTNNHAYFCQISSCSICRWKLVLWARWVHQLVVELVVDVFHELKDPSH